jgi:nucleotide-binding universal stress UspA family protein
MDLVTTRIIVGVDYDAAHKALGEGSLLAVEQASLVASAKGARVTLFHSGAADEHWDDREGGYVADGAEVGELANGVIERAADGLRAKGIEVDVVYSTDSAALAISRLAVEQGAELVVTGKRARGRYDERKIGSVSTKLLREAPCAVWILKPGASPRPRTIVAATDLSPVGTRAIRAAAEIARYLNASLHVVHAFQIDMEAQMGGHKAEFEQKRRGEATRQIEDDLGEDADLAEIHIGVSSPTRAVLDCEAQLEPDLVVMGTVSRGGIAGMLVGNTAERLLGKLDCSILAVKPADFVSPVAPAD